MNDNYSEKHNEEQRELYNTEIKRACQNYIQSAYLTTEEKSLIVSQSQGLLLPNNLPAFIEAYATLHDTLEKIKLKNAQANSWYSGFFETKTHSQNSLQPHIDHVIGHFLSVPYIKAKLFILLKEDKELQELLCDDTQLLIDICNKIIEKKPTLEKQMEIIAKPFEDLLRQEATLHSASTLTAIATPNKEDGRLLPKQTDSDNDDLDAEVAKLNHEKKKKRVSRHKRKKRNQKKLSSITPTRTPSPVSDCGTDTDTFSSLSGDDSVRNSLTPSPVSSSDEQRLEKGKEKEEEEVSTGLTVKLQDNLIAETENASLIATNLKSSAANLMESTLAMLPNSSSVENLLPDAQLEEEAFVVTEQANHFFKALTKVAGNIAKGTTRLAREAINEVSKLAGQVTQVAQDGAQLASQAVNAVKGAVVTSDEEYSSLKNKLKSILELRLVSLRKMETDFDHFRQSIEQAKIPNSLKLKIDTDIETKKKPLSEKLEKTKKILDKLEELSASALRTEIKKLDTNSETLMLFLETNHSSLVHKIHIIQLAESSITEKILEKTAAQYQSIEQEHAFATDIINKTYFLGKFFSRFSWYKKDIRQTLGEYFHEKKRYDAQNDLSEKMKINTDEQSQSDYSEILILLNTQAITKVALAQREKSRFMTIKPGMTFSLRTNTSSAKPLAETLNSARKNTNRLLF